LPFFSDFKPVGDAGYVDGGQFGLQAGHFAADEIASLSDATLPPLAWLPAVQGNVKISGIKGTFQYALDDSSASQIDDLNGSVYVASTNVVLYVRNSLKIPSGGQIFIPPDCSLTIYVGAANADIGGQDVVNMTGLARNFSYYGLPTNTAMDDEHDSQPDAQRRVKVMDADRQGELEPRKC
jgi:hypothetical protein